MRAAFYTLGCKVNQNESAALEQMFRAAGYDIVPMDAEADVYVVNSCTVTAGGDAKSRQWLRRARRQSPSAITVLTGCYPQAFAAEAAIPEADVVTGTTSRTRLLENIALFKTLGTQVVDVKPHEKNETFEELPTTGQTERTRAFVKVQDGCNRRCAYCIIPTARGPVRSRDEGSILCELRTLAADSYHEVVFTGINLPSYGRDTGTNLGALVHAATEVNGIERIRLSSLDPDLVTDEQIALFAQSPKLCRQFHLSLQSGCDTTLRRMRRPYTAAAYLAAANRLKAAMPGATFTTDVIVGFPGETDAEFEESLRFVSEMGFLKVHVFPFSPRPGTPAAGFEGQVGKAEKQARAKAMQDAADTIRASVMRSFAGETASVLLEKPLANGSFTGYTAEYLPVLVRAPGHKQGDIVKVTLGAPQSERLTASLC